MTVRIGLFDAWVLMSLRDIVWLVILPFVLALVGCAFDPVKTGYSQTAVRTASYPSSPSYDSLLVFRTSGFKVWAEQDAEFFINGELVAWFKSGGAQYFSIGTGLNTITVREPENFLKCELEFDFKPGSGQFVEIYERFDPSALVVSFILADLQSRLLFDPHPGTECTGVYGLSMGYVDNKLSVDVNREYGFQVD